MELVPQPLHPALVHLPIALALGAFVLAALARLPGRRPLDDGALVLIGLAAAGAVAAVLSGDAAAARAAVPAAAVALLERHEDLGQIAMWLLLAMLALRLALGALGRWRGAVPFVFLLLLALCAGLLAYNAHLGGHLVYRHGVGTDLLLAPPAPASAAPGGRGE